MYNAKTKPNFDECLCNDYKAKFLNLAMMRQIHSSFLGDFVHQMVIDQHGYRLFKQALKDSKSYIIKDSADKQRNLGNEISKKFSY